MAHAFDNEISIDEIFTPPNPHVRSSDSLVTQGFVATDLERFCEDLLADSAILKLLNMSCSSGNYLEELPLQRSDLQAAEFDGPTIQQPFINFPPMAKQLASNGLDSSLAVCPTPITDLDNSEIVPELSRHYQGLRRSTSTQPGLQISNLDCQFKHIVPAESMAALIIDVADTHPPRKRYDSPLNILHALTFKGLERIKVRSVIGRIIVSEDGEI